MVDLAGFSSGITTPGHPINSPVKGFTVNEKFCYCYVKVGQEVAPPSGYSIPEGLKGLRRGGGWSGCSSPNSKLEAILYCFWGVLGEVELARDSLEEVTEAESDSSLKMLLEPPGGRRTLEKNIKISIKKKVYIFFLDAWPGIDREDYQKRSSPFHHHYFQIKVSLSFHIGHLKKGLLTLYFTTSKMLNFTVEQ